jgi:hypothetical protein
LLAKLWRARRHIGRAVIAAELLGCSHSVEPPSEKTGSLREALTASPCANETILGFESAADWTVSSGAKSLSTVHTQGQFSLSVASPVNYTTLVSAPLNSSDTALAGLAVGTSFQIDVELPTQQPNPSWFGTLQMFISSPSRGVFNQYLGLVELTGTPLGVFQTFTFTIPNNVAIALAGQTYSDLTLTLALNVPSSGTGDYLFDNLRILGPNGSTTNIHPDTICVVPEASGRFEALFGYTNANTAARTFVPVGPNNQMSPTPVGQGQPQLFFPVMPSGFAAISDGGALTWSLAGGCAVASAQSPACPTTPCAVGCRGGQQCVGGQCVTVCGDGVCAGLEDCDTCPADCACAASQVCLRGQCAAP